MTTFRRLLGAAVLLLSMGGGHALAQCAGGRILGVDPPNTGAIVCGPREARQWYGSDFTLSAVVPGTGAGNATGTVVRPNAGNVIVSYYNFAGTVLEFKDTYNAAGNRIFSSQIGSVVNLITLGQGTLGLGGAVSLLAGSSFSLPAVATEPTSFAAGQIQLNTATKDLEYARVAGTAVERLAHAPATTTPTGGDSVIVCSSPIGFQVCDSGSPPSSGATPASVTACVSYVTTSGSTTYTTISGATATAGAMTVQPATLGDWSAPVTGAGQWCRYNDGVNPIRTSYSFTIAFTPTYTSTAWVGSTAYTVGLRRTNGANVYTVTTAGTSASSGGPTGTGTGIADGTVVWNYVSAVVAGTMQFTLPFKAANNGLSDVFHPAQPWTPGTAFGSAGTTVDFQTTPNNFNLNMAFFKASAAMQTSNISGYISGTAYTFSGSGEYFSQ